MTPAVAAGELSRSFGDLIAVDRLSFDVHPGELFGLVGPDGAGKTTTLRMLAGVLRPTGGDATVAGKSIVSDPEGVKTRIAYMSQRFGLYTDLTVEENLDFYADLYQVPRHVRRERLERLYEFSRLGPFKNRLAGALSGGMKQKLSLSCALIHKPEVLLLDEPTFGVDPISRRDLWLIVHHMVADGMTAIVSTAYMDEAERMDRVLMLDRGHVVALDTPAALQQRFDGRVLAVESDDPRETARLLRQVAGVSQATLFGAAVHAVFDDSVTDGRTIAAALTTRGIAVRATHEVDPSIEDLFIQLSERSITLQ